MTRGDEYRRHYETIEANWEMANLEFKRKFLMFFTGLVFAIISFAGAHPIQTSSNLIKIFDIIGLSFLLISGLLLLGKLSEIKIIIRNQSEPNSLKLIKKIKAGRFKKFWYIILYLIFNLNTYWYFFITAMVILLFDRSFVMFS